MPVEIAVIGAQRPFVLEALKSEFEVHDLIAAKDKVAALWPLAERIRGVATNAMTGLSRRGLRAIDGFRRLVFAQRSSIAQGEQA